MKPVDGLDPKEIVTAYVYANTPMYLYQHLRSIESLRELATESPISSLVEEYNEKTTKEKREEADIAIAYAMLIAVTFLEYRKALDAFDRFDLSRLDWGRDIKGIFIRTSPISNFISISQKPEISRIEQALSDSSTNILALEISPKSQNEE